MNIFSFCTNADFSRSYRILSSKPGMFLQIQLKLSLSTFYSDVIYQFNLFWARTMLRRNTIQDITQKDYPKTLLSIETLNWVFSNDSSSYKYYICMRKWHKSRLLSRGRLYGVTRCTGCLKINQSIINNKFFY